MHVLHLLRSLRDDLKQGTVRGQMVRSAGMTAILKAVSVAFAFVASLLYARVLGPHGYGLYAYVTAWAMILAIPSGMGLPQYLVREAAKAPASVRSLLRWADSRLLRTGVAAGALLAAGCLVPAAAGARWLFVIASPLPLLLNLASVRSALLQSQGAAARSQWPSQLLGPAVMLAALLAIWLWKGGLTPLQLMVAMIASSTIPLLINTVQLRRVSPAGPSSAAVDARVRDALPFMLISGLFLLNSRTDLIMLGALGGAHDAGIYAVAARAAEVTSFSMVAANMVLAPRVSRLHHEGNHALLQRMLDGSTRRVLLASTPIAAILIIAAYPLMTRLYGMEYAEGARVLQILAATQLLVVGSGPLGTLLNMTGHEGALARNMFLAVVANALLNLGFVPWLGATGAAIATAMSMVFSRILLWYQVRRLLGLRPTGLRH